MGISTGNDTEGTVTDKQDTLEIVVYYLQKLVDLIPQCQALYKHIPGERNVSITLAFKTNSYNWVTDIFDSVFLAQ